jgi:HAD superfamily hydrolase (TIGR01484 family)
MAGRKIRVVALDLDGTTLNSHHQVSDRTCQVLQRLSRSGVVIVLATGRSTLDIVKHFALFSLPQKVYPGVSYNGACGFVHEEGAEGLIRKDVFQRPLSKEQAQNLVAFAEEQDLVLQVKPILLYNKLLWLLCRS